MVNEEILKALNERNTSQSIFAMTSFKFDYTPYSRSGTHKPIFTVKRSKTYQRGSNPLNVKKGRKRFFQRIVENGRN
jgi:hypothetical protein